jgi:hypothetical protein
MLFVYTPNVSGTIISLEHHAKTHPRIHKWTQEATPSDDRGRITSLAADGTVVSQYQTMRSQGLYYIQDLRFVPAPRMETGMDSMMAATPLQPLSNGGRETINMLRTQARDTDQPTGMDDTNYTPDIETEHYQYLLKSQCTPTERPHQSLGAMVRCLLYAAAMPVQFWADALVYHHAGVDGVPYNIWTGKTANVSHLRMLGAHVTVHRSGTRPAKLDPHFYAGRFLRFGATAKNLVYYDEHTKRDKVARHCTLNELHFTSPARKRPPMANAIIRRSLSDISEASLPPDDHLMAAAQPDLHLHALDKLNPLPTEQ